MTGLRRVVSLAITVVLAMPVWMFFVPPAASGSSAGTVFITTVPTMAGVSLDVRGFFVTTDQSGAAEVSLPDINNVAADITLAEAAVPGGATVQINRIVPAAHVPHESHLTLGLDVTSPVKIKVLQENSHIPPSHVEELDLHSILGERRKLDPRRAQLLHLLSRKVHYVHGRLRAQPVTWAVEGVHADPGISVTSSQPRFDPFGSPTWKVHLAPVKGTVRVITEPRTPNVQFDVAGTALTTGPNGIGTAPVTDLNYVQDKLTLASSKAGQYQVSALRVSKLQTIVTGQRRLIAAIDVRRGVKLRFVDSHGKPIPASAIGQVTMSAGSGLITTLVGTALTVPPLLLTQVAERIGQHGWGTRTVNYSLSSVTISGANAVFQGKQRFTPLSSKVWTIELSVFSVSLSVRDALFGSTIGTRTVITRPDGSKLAKTVSSNTPRVFTGMVRGLYTLKIDAAVVGGSTSVLVSRDDQVDLRVITLLDAVVIALAGAMLLPAGVLVAMAVTRRSRRGGTEPGSGTE
ncbi:MAG TPA: hypothetical protein VGH43_04460 [Jatrophihabitans sp.]|jgi:hypothetical protein